MSQITELADACNNGACNISGLTISLGKAVQEEGVSNKAALKCIIGHLGFLLGETLGPSSQALQEYEESQNSA